MKTTDIFGGIGVILMLLAFLLNLIGFLKRDSYGYILLNLMGATYACVASILINYIPFIILEAVWSIASTIALIRHIVKDETKI